MKLTKIVVPTDFSDYSAAAMTYAMDFAEKWDAEIHLIYVSENIPSVFSSENDESKEQSFLFSLEDKARKKIKELAKFYSEEHETHVKPVLRSGINHEEIIKYAAEIESELIIIATHGRTGILYTLLGSVAEKVIQFAKCPVLVVKPIEEEE